MAYKYFIWIQVGFKKLRNTLRGLKTTSKEASELGTPG